MKVMFVCTGNICRSAMAEAMFKKMLEEADKNIEVYSCGIQADNENYATDNAIKVMKQYNIELINHLSTNIRDSEIEGMDLVLCATTRHKELVKVMYPELKGKIYTIKEYADYDKDDLDINDPWGFNIETYINCAKEIQDCLKKIINKV